MQHRRTVIAAIMRHDDFVVMGIAVDYRRTDAAAGRLVMRQGFSRDIAVSRIRHRASPLPFGSRDTASFAKSLIFRQRK
jgi:hypothetical protein